MGVSELPILVIKVGTSTLLDRYEKPSRTFDHVAASIAVLKERYRILLVTSGAIGFGVTRLGLDERPADVDQLQALSMIGQVGLLKRWREACIGMTIGQVLVTRRDLERDSTATALRRSVEAVWRYGALPIMNENDAVSHEEISFGDNDQLAAEAATVLEARALVFLTDQDGIRANFGTDAEKRLVTVSVDAARQHVKPAASTVSRGGALSKLQAARIALAVGTDVYVAHAAKAASIEDTLSGKAGTKLVE